MSAGISIMDLARRKQVTAKLGKMRKPQTFSVYPKQPGDKRIIVQSEKSIGEFDPITGEGCLYVGKSSAYFVHMSYALPFLFPPEFVAEAREIWDPKPELEIASARIETASLDTSGTITIKPYRNGLHGVRVAGSAAVPRTGAHFTRWNKKS